MTKMISIPIAGATEQQLRDFADVQQYDISSVRPGDIGGLLAVIGAAWPGDSILAVAPEFDTVAAASPFAQETPVSIIAQNSLTGGTGANDPKVIIKIGQTPYPGGKDPVPLGHNGKTVVLQRNLLTELPYRYYLVLLDAMRGDLTQEEDKDGKMGELLDTEFTNYPLQQVTLPSPEEIRAWHERTDNVLMPA